MANVGGMQRVAAGLHEALENHSRIELNSLVLRVSWRWTHVRSIPFMLGVIFKLRHMLRRGEVDVVLFSSMVTASLVLALGRSALRRASLTVIAHGRDITLPVPAYQWLVPKMLDRLSMVFAVSRATGERCNERGLPPHRLCVIPNGVTTDASAAASGVKPKVLAAVPENAFVLCGVGRLVERKGFTWFVDQVMPLLPDDVVYVLVGDGPRAKDIDRLIATHELSERVLRVGQITDDDLREVYQLSDLLIMSNLPVPGDHEGFGVVMLEAGLSGTPVIASDLEGISDVVREGVNGHLVPSQRPRAFADLICRYRNDRNALLELSETAQVHVKSNYSWRQIAERFVEGFEGLRAGNGRQPN